jgi:transposase
MIRLAFCWCHVRRDFTGILIRYPGKKVLTDWADDWIKWIGQLYAINNRRLAVRNDPEQFQIKQRELEQAVLKLRQRSMENYALPEQNKIMTSLQNHWQGLTLFVDNPDIPMDNNIAENMLRLPVVGRKNYYGNHSEFGGTFSAMMFTFIQTCILHKINPYAYLKYYLTECAKNGRVPDNIEQFMPHRLKENGPQELLIES